MKNTKKSTYISGNLSCPDSTFSFKNSFQRTEKIIKNIGQIITLCWEAKNKKFQRMINMTKKEDKIDLKKIKGVIMRLNMRARSTISVISRNSESTFFQVNHKKAGCAFFCACDCVWIFSYRSILRRWGGRFSQKSASIVLSTFTSNAWKMNKWLNE